MGAQPSLVVDWVSLLGELRRLGYSLRGIADQIQLSHSLLVQYAQGVNRPLHSTGEKLVAFYLQTTGKQREQLPMVQEIARRMPG